VTSTIGERLLWRDGDFTISQCVFCAHKSETGTTCAAFLEGIPSQILRNEVDHRRPFAGDRQTRFELAGDDVRPYLAATRFPA